MTDFLVAMSPAIFFFTVPLMPMFYTAIVATVDRLSTRSGRAR